MKHFIFFCAIALPIVVRAQVPRTWVGGSSGNWSDSSKWSGVPAGTPTALDPVGMNNTSPASTPVLDVDATVASLFMNGSSILAGSTDQTLTVNGLWDMSPGISRLGGVGAGRLTFQANGGVSFRNASSGAGLDNIHMNLASGYTTIHQDFVGGTTTTVRNGTTINNAGNYEARSNGGFSHGGGTTTVFNNTGTFTRNTAAGEWFTNMVFNNSGSVNVNTGTLRLGGGGVSSGAFNVGSSALLYFSGPTATTFTPAAAFSGAGTVKFESPGSATIAQYNITGGTTVSGGTVTFNDGAGAIGAVTLSGFGSIANFNGSASPTSLNIANSGGSANFANDVSVAGVASLNAGTLSLPTGKICTLNGTTTWSGATLAGGGTFVLNAGGTTTSGAPKLYGAILNLPAGQTYVDSYNAGGGTVELRSAAVINNAGTWEYLGDRNIFNGLAPMSRFNNTGTFTKRNNPSSTVSFQIPFNNSGTVNASAGTLRMTGQSFTQTAGQLVLNGGIMRAAFNLPLLIQGGAVTGSGTIEGGVNVTGGTVKPRGILAIQDTDSGTTKGDLTLTSASTLDVELGGTNAGTQYDRVTEQGNVAFARNGLLAVRFRNGFQYSIANTHNFSILTSNANTTGQFSNVSGGRVTTADFKGHFAINAAGTASVVLSDFQGYPDLDVEQPAGNDLADGTATVNYGLKTIGTPGVARTFTVKNTGAADLTGLALSIDGTNAADFSVSTPLPASTLAPEGSAAFTVTFTPTGSGLRTAMLRIASNDPNEAPFDIALTGEGNFAPVLQLPLADVEVEPTDINGAVVNFTVSATDFEDEPDPTAIASPASGSLFPLGDTTVIVSATDSRGVTTTGTFTVRVPGGDPGATTLVPNAITINSATLRATVNPNHFATSVQFVMDGNPLNPPVNVPAGSSPVTVTFNVSGLQPGTAHTANVQAVNATGHFISGGTVNFTTLGGPPAVTTTAPTMITPTKARLTAIVNPNHLPTSVSFYAGSTLLGTVSVPAGSSLQTVTFDYQQLIPGQLVTYHVVGTNQLSPTPVNGGNNSFNLLPSDTTMGNAHNFFYAANAGWINTRPATRYGFRTGDTVCSGFLYAANFGWIHAGTGEPANGIRYSNTNGDYGVNVLPDGTLRGLAWGQNIGWVNFEPNGAPAIDPATGALTGYAWGQNIGWIHLATATTTQLALLDTDHDGISDAWENERASGNLTSLTATGDADGDGQSDSAEFSNDTDPLNSADQFQITGFSQINGGGFVDIAFTSKTTRFYQVLESSDLSPGSWQDAGPGILYGQPAFTNVSLNGPAVSRKFYRVTARRPLQGP